MWCYPWGTVAELARIKQFEALDRGQRSKGSAGRYAVDRYLRSMIEKAGTLWNNGRLH